MIDLDEINLNPDVAGSARVIRHGKKHAKMSMEKARKRPLWKRQLNTGHSRRVGITLSKGDAERQQ